MKTFEEYNWDNFPEMKIDMEETFLELSHLDKLEISFDFIDNDEWIFYFYKNREIFDQNKISKIFYINLYEIWSPIQKKFELDYQVTSDFMKDMIEKYFKINGYSVGEDDCFTL
ncbi:hypothetical protein M0Q50_02295 [bacterium]|jgi:hypothetical protein|nr:hypothetical protein [bacterium]